MDSIEPGTVFRKTAKGQQEIELRTHKLGMKQRTALILVDGERAAESIIVNLPGNGEELLLGLYREEFIALASGDAPAARPAAAPAAAASPVREPAAVPASFDLPSTQRAAVHAVEDVLGPEGESIALKIERTTSNAELMAVLERTRELIRGSRGEARATKFWQAIFK
ncbi:MAG: hypothetical protein JNK75_13945 [Betaproteobacteria bacterium]|nr:hypothetical protein [Betaproteobacteria bacterium]